MGSTNPDGALAAFTYRSIEESIEKGTTSAGAQTDGRGDALRSWTSTAAPLRQHAEQFNLREPVSVLLAGRLCCDCCVLQFTRRNSAHNGRGKGVRALFDIIPIEKGGSEAWRLNPERAVNCEYLVCPRNRHYFRTAPSAHSLHFDLRTDERLPGRLAGADGGWQGQTSNSRAPRKSCTARSSTGCTGPERSRCPMSTALRALETTKGTAKTIRLLCILLSGNLFENNFRNAIGTGFGGIPDHF